VKPSPHNTCAWETLQLLTRSGVIIFVHREISISTAEESWQWRLRRIVLEVFSHKTQLSIHYIANSLRREFRCMAGEWVWGREQLALSRKGAQVIAP